MDKKAMQKLGSMLEKAVVMVLQANNVPMAQIEIVGTDAGDLIIKVNSPKTTAMATGLTPNAVARYKAAWVKLGLPAIGTAVKIAGVEHKLLGLSTDGKQVKARAAGATSVVDVPLADVLHAVSMTAAAQVAKLETDEQAQPVDQIDPSVTSLLAGVFKPAEEGPK